MPKEQARTFTYVLYDASRGRFDYELAIARLADSGFTHEQAVVVARSIEDVARCRGLIAGEPRWGFVTSSDGARAPTPSGSTGA